MKRLTLADASAEAGLAPSSLRGAIQHGRLKAELYGKV